MSRLRADLRALDRAERRALAARQRALGLPETAFALEVGEDALRDRRQQAADERARAARLAAFGARQEPLPHAMRPPTGWETSQQVERGSGMGYRVRQRRAARVA